jgi:DUF4097 and DUF4098 domain-containing protein YvlB
MKARFNIRRTSVLAAAFATMTLSSVACGTHLMAQEEARDQWTRSYTVGRGATVELLNTNGTISVAAAEGDTVSVAAERIVKASTEARARERLADFEIRESASATHVRIDSRHTGLSLGVSRVVNYTVTVPRWANVTLETTNGAVTVSGLAGELRIDATNGRIEASGLENGARVDATNGAIMLDFASLGAQGVDCETVNGAITITLPRDADADVSARVTNGGISADDLKLDITEESRRRLDGRLGGGGSRVRLETVNGAIRLRGR